MFFDTFWHPLTPVWPKKVKILKLCHLFLVLIKVGRIKQTTLCESPEHAVFKTPLTLTQTHLEGEAISFQR